MPTDAELISALSEEERVHVASWAVKTSRTEEWTGQQVMRLLTLVGHEPLVGTAELVLQQAREELNHAKLYAEVAQRFRDAAWCSAYCTRAKNFSSSGFTQILRTLDSTPTSHAGPSLIRFFTGLFFLDLAGLMTVNVYEESPFASLQDVALVVRSDEGRHVHHGREFLLRSSESAEGKALLRDAVVEMLPQIDAFFGGDDSPVQQTLHKVGIRKTPNSALKSKFREKVSALLHLG